MNLFYIYAIWCELGNKNSTEWSRVVIVFPSRQDADEYFRALQDLKQDSGANMFALLSRRSPQFWLYSIPGSSMYNAVKKLPDEIRWKGALTVLPASYHTQIGQNWTIIPITNVPDWVSGRTYFIRNKRQPESYWYVDHGHDNRIHVSTELRTKFRITAAQPQKGTKDHVLIRSDLVMIECVGRPSASRTEPALFISASSPSGGRLEVSTKLKHWHFGAFFEAFAVDASKNELGQLDNVLYWTIGGEGDVWEPC